MNSSEFPFADAPNTACFTCRHVLNERINRVTTALSISKNFFRFFLPLAERAFSLAKRRFFANFY